LTVLDGRVRGTLTIVVSGVTSTFDVTGSRDGRRLRLTGELLPQHVRWVARWSASRDAWRGPLLVRGGGRLRGMASLRRDAGDPATGCGFDGFTTTLLPQLFVPVCGRCHVAGGQAARTRLRVTPDDAATTARSALGLVDAAAPEQSLLLEKPRNDVAHGGGQQIVSGSAHEQMLLDWIRAVTAPSCGGGAGGTGDPYLDHCASCHGDDGRGLDGRPDIRCNRDVRPVVRSGRVGPAGEMPAFPDLRGEELDAIQARLLASCPEGTATGEELFAGNCRSCHGDAAAGTATAPRIRCATRVANAIRVGRGRAMPAMSAIGDVEVSLISAYLDDACTSAGRSGEDLWAGNCAGCHGTTARGGRNGLGVDGPDVRCTGRNDFVEKVAEGDEAMPSFPKLHAADVHAIVDWVHGTYCGGGGDLNAAAGR
jgi:mono/diheme cytochrome c family protein